MYKSNKVVYVEIPDQRLIYANLVEPLQILFKENMKYAIKKQGKSYRSFSRLLKEKAGINVSVQGLIYVNKLKKGANSFYYFCAISHLLNIPVIDLFREDFVHTYKHE